MDVTRKDVEETSSFCLMSRRKSEGYRLKSNWLSARFEEDLRTKMLDLSEDGRGFIEFSIVVSDRVVSQHRQPRKRLVELSDAWAENRGNV